MRGILIASVLAGAGGVAAAQPTVTTTTTTTTTVSFAPPAMTPAETPAVTAKAPVTAPADRGLRLAVAVGVGRGFDTKDRCDDTCLGVDGEIGVAIRPRLLALVGVTAMISNDLHEQSHHEETLALQYWPRDRLWLEGGAGIGTARTPEDTTTMSTELEPSVTAAVGYEAFALAHQSVGVQLRFASAVTDLHHTSYLTLLLGAAFN